MRIRVPSNAKSFSFQFRFFTSEYPQFTCQVYNDVFAVLMDPNPLPPSDPIYPDIAFETVAGGKKNVIGVNNQSFLTACKPSPQAPGYVNCRVRSICRAPASRAPPPRLAPVAVARHRREHHQPPLRHLGLQDGVFDSTVVVDDFRWRAEEGQLGTVITGRELSVRG